VNPPPEHRDHLVEALATNKRGPGCGCLGWAVFAVVFLLVGGGAIGVWRPLIVLPVFFIVVGAGLWTLFAVLRNVRVRGRYDPRDADRRPAAPAAGDPSADPPAHPAHPQAAPMPLAAGGEIRAGAPADPAPAAAPPSLPAAAPDFAMGPAGALPVDLRGVPQAPEAPEAPASPWD
jgi:hypothetical protein